VTSCSSKAVVKSTHCPAADEVKAGTSFDCGGASAVGTLIPSAGDCTTDGQVGCKTVDAFKAADMRAVLPENLKSGTVIAGISGSASFTALACTATYQQGCIASGGIVAADKQLLDICLINNGQTLSDNAELALTNQRSQSLPAPAKPSWQWRRDAAGASGYATLAACQVDGTTCYLWQVKQNLLWLPPSHEMLTFEEAQDACHQVSVKTGAAWRLPIRRELLAAYGARLDGILNKSATSDDPPLPWVWTEGDQALLTDEPEESVWTVSLRSGDSRSASVWDSHAYVCVRTAP